MSKLRYYYGAMNSMKSATLLMKAHQFEQSGCEVVLIKPKVDTRDIGVIKARPIPEGRICATIGEDENIIDILTPTLKECFNDKQKVVIFADEVQFFTEKHIEELFYIAKEYEVEVFAYGLKLSYKNELFQASKKLLILADTIEEIKSMCECGRKATTHVRFVNDIPTLEGLEFTVGDIQGTERYKSVCQVCWHQLLLNVD